MILWWVLALITYRILMINYDTEINGYYKKCLHENLLSCIRYGIDVRDFGVINWIETILNQVN